MAKVVKLPTPQDNVIDPLEIITEKARNGEIASFVFAAKVHDGSIVTAWGNTDVFGRNELVSHLQMKVFYDAIEENLV